MRDVRLPGRGRSAPCNLGQCQMRPAILTASKTACLRQGKLFRDCLKRFSHMVDLRPFIAVSADKFDDGTLTLGFDREDRAYVDVYRLSGLSVMEFDEMHKTLLKVRIAAWRQGADLRWI